MQLITEMETVARGRCLTVTFSRNGMTSARSARFRGRLAFNVFSFFYQADTFERQDRSESYYAITCLIVHRIKYTCAFGQLASRRVLAINLFAVIVVEE